LPKYRNPLMFCDDIMHEWQGFKRMARQAISAGHAKVMQKKRPYQSIDIDGFFCSNVHACLQIPDAT
jgi:hypothetical protein